MNGRMREILDDAEVIWDKPDAHNPLALVSLEEFKEILETVVKECADIGERYADGNYEIRNQILEHFGLEEE
jgi:hypothetical protein